MLDDCKHQSTFFITGKVCDSCYWTFPNGSTGDGYVPSFSGFGRNSDYLELTICLDCRCVVGFDPDEVRSAQDKGKGDE